MPGSRGLGRSRLGRGVDGGERPEVKEPARKWHSTIQNFGDVQFLKVYYSDLGLLLAVCLVAGVELESVWSWDEDEG